VPAATDEAVNATPLEVMGLGVSMGCRVLRMAYFSISMASADSSIFCIWCSLKSTYLAQIA